MKTGQKLTLVYDGDFQITRHKHVEVQDGDTLDSICEREIHSDSTALWLVFEGHCKLLGGWGNE